MHFVLDNSVVMRWLFGDGSATDLNYAKSILDTLGVPEAHAKAPSIWPLEVANVVARAESKNMLLESQSSQFLRLLDALAIEIDADTAQHALTTTLQLARRYALSAYDAAYLELALRESLPIATLDDDLRSAAVKAGVAQL